jgi:hypothetical protein
MLAYPTQVLNNGKRGTATVSFTLQDPDGLPLSVKLSVRYDEDPLREAGEKLRRLMPDVEEVVVED